MSILDRLSLEDKTALVAGAGRGIGESLATALAEACADVAVLDINLETADATAESLRALGRKSITVQTDVRIPDQVSSTVSTVTPENIADAVCFLASDEARAITGVILPIDAGWLVAASWHSYGGVRDAY